VLLNKEADRTHSALSPLDPDVYTTVKLCY